MLMLQKFEADQLETAQQTDRTALANARQALAALNGADATLNAFGGEYAQFLTSATQNLLAVEINAQAQAQSQPARYGTNTAPVMPVPPATPAPSVAILHNLSQQIAGSRAQIAGTIHTLETAISTRAARIQSLREAGK